ncbi:phage portal protein [Methyloceanibacter methanicus]|uniref:phage portal protein n=1 Tax=Methyloceanibacter methanicus TaxID=1774968 RepID=UPI000B29E908|nr:phage portal protein [Methyloceanibacter methanicus]
MPRRPDALARDAGNCSAALITSCRARPDRPASALRGREQRIRRLGREAWISALCGTGIKPQSGHPDPNVREQINLAFERWTDEADADGLLDFYGLMALGVRRMVVDGESFAAFDHSDPNVPLRLRLIDQEQVDSSKTQALSGGASIVQGVEVDETGRRLAYHLFKKRPGLTFDWNTETVRMPATEMLHLFNPVSSGQARGLSWYAPVLLRLADLDASHDAQLVRQKIAALLTGFIIDIEGDGGSLAGTAGLDGISETSLEPGEMRTLKPGQDVRFSEPARVGAEVIDFLNITAREIASGLGVPYAAMTGDLSDVNYSSIRAGLVDWRRRVEALQYNVIVYRFCRPVWNRFVTAAVLSGQISAPGFERDPAPYLSVNWITPRFDWVDPLKDCKAEIAAIAAGLISRRQAVAARGIDIEDLDREIAADRDRAKKLGLAFGDIEPGPEVQA